MKIKVRGRCKKPAKTSVAVLATQTDTANLPAIIDLVNGRCAVRTNASKVVIENQSPPRQLAGLNATTRF